MTLRYAGIVETGRCRECMLIRDVRQCWRYGGGTYRRSGRQYQSRICEECARSLLATATAGQMSVRRWGIQGLRRAWPEAS